MSAVIKTEAIVLKSINYRETSKIVTFYTRAFGKIGGVVKGARRRKNKYGSSLEPMAFISLILYRKEGRDLGTVAECSLLKRFPRLTDDLDKMAVGISITELLAIVAQEEENGPLFQLVVVSLDTLNAATKNPRNVFYYFELHLARLLGFQPLFGKCVSCGSPSFFGEKPGEHIEYHLDKGGPLCRKCVPVAGHKVRLRPRPFRILERISGNKGIDGIPNIEIDEGSRLEIESFLWSYLIYHVPGLRPLKSMKVFSRVLSHP